MGGFGSIVLLLAAVPALAADSVRVVFDTDVGNDVDDALALSMLHSLESRGEAKLLAVTITKDNRWAAPYVDLVNTFYRRPDIPVGVVRNGKTPEDSKMIRIPAERRHADGSFVYPHRIVDGREAAEATEVLRRILSKERDRSVVMVQVGFSTNLVRLLDLQAGRDLVASKVRLLCVMAGAFPAGKPEFNIKMDIPAAIKLFQEWPTPIVASGYEIGESILFPAASIEKDFRYVENHPVAEAYRLYKRMPYDRPTWDLTAVLYAVRPQQGYFSVSTPGTISVDTDGRTRFISQPSGEHRYLTITDSQRELALKAMIELASRPPDK